MTQPEITYAWHFNPRHAANNEPNPKAECTARCGDEQQTYEISYRPDADNWEVRSWDEECQPANYIGAYRDLDAAQAAIQGHAQHIISAGAAARETSLQQYRITQERSHDAWNAIHDLAQGNSPADFKIHCYAIAEPPVAVVACIEAAGNRLNCQLYIDLADTPTGNSCQVMVTHCADRAEWIVEFPGTSLHHCADFREACQAAYASAYRRLRQIQEQQEQQERAAAARREHQRQPRQELLDYFAAQSAI